MSVCVVLLPTILLAAGAAGGVGAIGTAGAVASALGAGAIGTTLGVQTRMRDRGLLSHALTDLGAEVTRDDDAGVEARLGDIAIEMVPNAEGVWGAHLDSAEHPVTVDEATEIMRALDAHYAARVQSAVVARIRERAPQAGFQVASESVADDDSVRIVLDVVREVS